MELYLVRASLEAAVVDPSQHLADGVHPPVAEESRLGGGFRRLAARRWAGDEKAFGSEALHVRLRSYLLDAAFASLPELGDVLAQQRVRGESGLHVAASLFPQSGTR